jgi:hypothetical protein
MVLLSICGWFLIAASVSARPEPLELAGEPEFSSRLTTNRNNRFASAALLQLARHRDRLLLTHIMVTTMRVNIVCVNSMLLYLFT